MTSFQARLLISAVLLLLLTLPGWLWAADVSAGGFNGDPVDLEADQLSFDEQAGRYLARGNVKLKQGDLQLQSDELWWHRESGEVEATGKVVLQGAEDRMTGQRVRYNLNDGTGFVEEGRAFLREHNLRLSGALIEKRGEAEYRVIDGTFTTCVGEVPSWKFGAGQLDVTVDGYARAQHAVFYLKDIPSFYVPYMVYPAKTERESGLLTPRFGYSDRRGTEISGAYYQVIARNQDATVYLDYLSELGLGKGLEYRYIFGRDNVGKARGYHINSNTRNDDDLYALAWDHEGTLPGNVRLSAETEYVSERDYFEDFGEEAEQYNKDQTLSVIYLSRNWGLYNLVGQLRYSENLERDDPTTLQWLPRINFDAVRQQIGTTPLYYTLGSEYTYFWREEGLKGQRLRVRPSLLASLKLWNVIDLVPEIGWTERQYWTSSEGPGHEHKGLYDFSTRLSSRFYRVYPWASGSVSRLRHMVEPDVTYVYIPNVDQEDLPEFDRFDRIEDANRIDYGVTQRLTTKSESEEGLTKYRDLLFFRLSQSYDLGLDGKLKERLSPVRGQLSLDPVDYFQLHLDSHFDVDRGRWNDYSGETRFQDRRGNSLGLQYRREKFDADIDADADADADADEIDYGRLDLKTAWLKPVYLGYKTRYEFTSSENLEQVLNVTYRHQCWSLTLTLRDRLEDQSFMVTFSLGGIGTVGSVGGDLGGS